MTQPTSFDSRLRKVDRDLARLELQARQTEFADLESDRVLAELRGDRAAVMALRPKLAEFAALQARAHAPEPAAFVDPEAEADEILREHGLIAPLSHSPPVRGAVVSLREPDLADPRSRGVAVAAGDTEQVFTAQDADREAEALLREFGLEPKKPSAAF